MRGAEFAVSFALQLIKAVYAFEQMDKKPSMSDLAEFLKTNYHSMIRYRKILEKEGLIEVVPEGPRNIVRLTDRGRCLAKCLVG